MKVYVLAMVVLLLMGAAEIQAANNFATDTTMTRLTQPFPTIDQAARAIWSARVGKGDCTTFVLGPIPGKTSFYVVYFLTPDYKSFYGIATIIIEGKHFCIPPMGGSFFYPSGKADGVFNPCLYDEAKVRKYLTDCHPEIGTVQSIRLIQPGVSIYPWLWEVTSNGQTHYLYVIDDKGTAQLMTKAALDQARAADVVKVDSVITDRRK